MNRLLTDGNSKARHSLPVAFIRRICHSVEVMADNSDVTLAVAKPSDGATVFSANVVTADIKAEVGIFHVIETVVLSSN